MADQRFSAQAGPVNHLYEFGNAAQGPPIPPKQPEVNPAAPENGTAYGYDGQQQYQQQAGSFPARSPSAFAPQAIDQQQQEQYSPNGIASIPKSPTRTSHSPQPPQGHLAPSTVVPIESTQPQYGGSEASYGNNSHAAAAPHYNAPVAGYYGSGMQYNPNQSYGVGAAPYPQAQSPPPVKAEAENYYSAGPPPPPPAVPPTGPPAGAVAPAAGGDKKKKRICGMTVTIFLVLCVILFLVVAGAILGVVMVLIKKPDPPTPSPVTTSGPPSTIVFPSITTTSFDTNSITTTPTPTTTTTTTTTTNNNNYAYQIPTGTWTITGLLAATTGTCINNPNTTNYKEVWYCPDPIIETVVIRNSSSSTKLDYYLDMDTPTRARGLSGVPPTGINWENGTQPYWAFSSKYQQQAPYSKQGDCEVNVDLIFFLRTESAAQIYLQVDSPNVCMQPGGNSTAGVSCTCLWKTDLSLD